MSDSDEKQMTKMMIEGGCTLKEAELAWNHSVAKLVWRGGLRKRGLSGIRQEEYTKCKTIAEMRKLYADAKYSNQKKAFGNTKPRDDFMWDLKRGLLSVEMPSMALTKDFFQPRHKHVLDAGSMNLKLSAAELSVGKKSTGSVAQENRENCEKGQDKDNVAASKACPSTEESNVAVSDPVPPFGVAVTSQDTVAAFHTPIKKTNGPRKKRVRQGSCRTQRTWADIFGPSETPSQKDSPKKLRIGKDFVDPGISAVVAKPGFYDSSWLLSSGPASPPTKTHPVLLP